MSLVLEQVRKSYREPDGQPLPVLNVDAFQIASGEQVALVGQSGGGKTTLLNVISGITAADSGKVLVDGTDVTRLHEAVRDRFRAERIGIVFQTFNLLPAFSAFENVLLGMAFSGRVDRGFAKQLRERVGLGHRLTHRPGQLSVGEQQRVAVARALVGHPSILLADEPTGNLDSKTGVEIMTLFERLHSGGNTIVLVTHEADIASHAHRVIHIRDGQVERDVRNAALAPA
jgi:putative ABC transport system ATP-binding protein